jgi:hypothetical protein
MVVSAPALDHYYPRPYTYLVDEDWAGVPHSDDGVTDFVVTNLAYSSPSGGATGCGFIWSPPTR